MRLKDRVLVMLKRTGFAIFLICSLSWTSESKELRILHFNDFHGFARPHMAENTGTLKGGAPWLASKAKFLAREKPTLFVAAGDMIQGDVWANLFRGESVIRLLNSMELDAMVVGNHEFDFGQEVLIQRIREAIFPVLGANVKGLEILKKYVIKEIGGLRVALVGVVTQDTPIATHPRNVTGLKFEDPEATLKGIIQRISHEVDVLVVLSHCGYTKDREMAQRVSGIHVIIGGHSHTRLQRPVKVGGTLIAQAWEHGKALGVLDLLVEGRDIKTWDGWLEDIWPGGWEEDPLVADLVEEYSKRLSQAMGEIVGESLVDLDGSLVRYEETNLGNLVADVVKEFSGAQVAIINGGSIRKGIPSGPVTRGQIHGALPFDNYVVAMTLKGSELCKALEHGLSGKGSGRFPQVSGLRVIYSSEASSAARLKGVWIMNEPVRMDAEYSIATNDFLAAGGDGYSIFREAVERRETMEDAVTKFPEGAGFSAPGHYIKDLVVEYFQRQGKVNPKREGRIIEEGSR